MSHYKTGTVRDLVRSGTLDEQIGPENPVRVIDAFVDMLDLTTFGFQHAQVNHLGTPCYHPAVMLKIYLYGYFNRIRSSRGLEKECERNIEMRWLCQEQMPSYHSISTFRTFKDEKANINHPKTLKEVFRAFNRFLSGEGLFGKETVAVDGTKIRAQNSRKKNHTEERLKKKLELLDNSIEEYLEEPGHDHLPEKGDFSLLKGKGQVPKKLEELRGRKAKYEALQEELESRQAKDPTVTQISQTDPEARSMVINNSGHAEISYNVVTAVDDKHCLIADFSTENIKDDNLLASSMLAVKAEFDTNFAPDMKEKVEDSLKEENKLIVLADKGFHAADQLARCQEHNIETYVAVPQQARSGKDKAFTKYKFKYDEGEDAYVCPAGEQLKTNGNLYKKMDKRGQLASQFTKYFMKHKTCEGCRFKDRCLSSHDIENRLGRSLERNEHQKAVDENSRRMQSESGKKRYKRRQAIVEHPFGTIKRSWGNYYTLLKGKEKVTGEFALVFTCYNMRRAINIQGFDLLMKRMKEAKSLLQSSWEAFWGVVARLLADMPFFAGFQPKIYRAVVAPQ